MITFFQPPSAKKPAKPDLFARSANVFKKLSSIAISANQSFREIIDIKTGVLLR